MIQGGELDQSAGINCAQKLPRVKSSIRLHRASRAVARVGNSRSSICGSASSVSSVERIDCLKGRLCLKNGRQKSYL